LRLRGPSGAEDEFLLAAITQNPDKLAEMKRAGERERSPAPVSLTVIAAPGCTVP